MGSSSGKCLSTARLDGKTAIVTGANTGIGKETVKDFFQRGARVVLACRSAERANDAINDIQKQCANSENLGQLSFSQLDLMSLSSVRSFARQILENEERIDILVNNAGVMMCPEGRTEDGFETQIGTNHFGPFLLTLLLLPKIRQSASARIVNVASSVHKTGVMDFEDLNWEKRPYHAQKAYHQSKLANVLFSKELARRLAESHVQGVNVYSLHPGVIATDLGRHLDKVYFRGARVIFSVLGYWYVKTPLQGAQTQIYCAVDEKCADQTGLYYSDCAVKEPSAAAKNVEDAKRLWEDSVRLVGLDTNYDPFKQ